MDEALISEWVSISDNINIRNVFFVKKYKNDFCLREVFNTMKTGGFAIISKNEIDKIKLQYKLERVNKRNTNNMFFVNDLFGRSVLIDINKKFIGEF